VISVLTWSPDEGLREGLNPADLPALLARPDRVVWVDLNQPTAGETAVLSDVFHFHPLAIEDCRGAHAHPQHPKIEDFRDYLFILTHGVTPDASSRDFRTRTLSLFLGKNFLVSYHRDASRSVEQAMESARRNPKVMEQGSDSVLYTILDFQVEQYLPVLEQFEKSVTTMEERVFDTPTREVLQGVLAVRRSLMRLRRISGHQRDILTRLVRREFPMIDEKAIYHLRDVQDHLVRITDLADTFREIVAGALEAHLSIVSNRTNEVMRVLTVVSTLFIPLTFIVGVYGMNFEHFPELRWRYGYPAVWVVMIAVAFGMIRFFRKRGISGEHGL